MNAILVFDPSNDLIFSHSNTEFKSCVIKYAKLNRLMRQPRLAPFSRPARRRSEKHFSKESLRGESSSDEDQDGRPQSLRVRSHELDDDDKKFLEILMLLLTPYAASLRIELNQRRQTKAECAESDDDLDAGLGESRSDVRPNGRLLDKFMASINIEQAKGGTSTRDRAPKDLRFENTKSKFSSTQIPIECLSSCQVVYCDIDDFLFIYLQHLESLSSFKMRLLQKRIDLFARLALLLCGPALNTLKASSTNESEATQADLNQAQILRLVYQIWLEQQFELNFMLEAYEPLLLSRQVEEICHCSLRRLALFLRKSAPQYGAEIHMHSLLLAGSKLVHRHSCQNSYNIAHDDLILIFLLAKAFDPGHSVTKVRNSGLSSWFDPAQKNHTGYKRSRKSSDSSHVTGGHNRSWSKRRIQRVRKFQNLPSQFLIFLSATRAHNDRDNPIKVPHMIRFLPLANTNQDMESQGSLMLVLLSEIPTSCLAVQFHRSLRTVHGFMKQPNSLTLNELSSINDCISTLKGYFFSDPNADMTDLNRIEHSVRKSRSSWSISSLFNKYTPSRQSSRESVHRPESPETSGALNCESEVESYLAETLGIRANLASDVEQRCSRQLICRMEDLAANNVHSYMRKTFNIPTDQHKREALLTSVAGSLRDAYDLFIIKPLLARLNEPIYESWRCRTNDQMDEATRLIRNELADCFDYLDVKSTCNLTLGAPLTHDMIALRSFIHLDRSRHSMLVAPMSKDTNKDQSGERLTQILEGDIFSLFATTSDSAAPHEVERSDIDKIEESTSSNHSSPSPDDLSSRDGDSDTDSSDTVTRLRRSRRKVKIRSRAAVEPATGRLFLATSEDILSPNAITSASSVASEMSSALGTGKSSHRFTSRSDLKGSSSQSNIEAEMFLDQNDKDLRLVNENLVKTFTCFIYNRLANGKCGSFSTNDGTYIFSYFIWFEHNSVRYREDTNR